MEQTVNTWSKGLQMDTNPMVQGNDSLTNALNATFVTMNGNEVILQNDMGNRRVDNAYLQPGYVPVGMKEYGGIIYIASYNPITGRSQVGSFPSPQRKFYSDSEDDLGGNLDLEYFEKTFISTTWGNVNMNFLKNESIMLPLIGENVLHAGDKFTVYSTYIWKDEIKKDLSNFQNTQDGKVITPKNKKYTLSLGVLNSQNEFVDITKTLVRWDGKEYTPSGQKSFIKYDDNESSLYKFNDGYFIANTFNNNTLTETAGDTEFIQRRLVFPGNTYVYKLVGPLYLKAEYNHVREFNYNIEGSWDGTLLELWIESTLIYNCPDKLVNTPSSNDDDYISYQDGELENYTGFDTYLNNELITDIENRKALTSYNKGNNIYTASVIKKITKTYENLSEETQKNFPFILGVLANEESKTIPDKKSLYLEGLSIYDTIDLTKLGSGALEISAWRFFNYPNERRTQLIYGFNAYPKYGMKFMNLYFRIIDVFDEQKVGSSKAKTILLGDAKPNAGNVIWKDFTIPAISRNTITLDWDNLELEFRKLYRVEIYCYGVEKSSNIDNGVTGKDLDDENKKYPALIATRWLLTTELMNSCYNNSQNEMIVDYGNPNKIEEEKLGGLSENTILDNKLSSINVTTEFNYEDNCRTEYNFKTTKCPLCYSTDWDSFSRTTGNNTQAILPYNINIKVDNTTNPSNTRTHKHYVSFPYTLITKVYDIDLYPDFVEENQSSNFEAYIENNSISIDTSEINIDGKGVQNISKENFIKESKKIINSNGTSISGELDINDICKFNYIQPDDVFITNPFAPFDFILPKLISDMTHFGGVEPDWDNNNTSTGGTQGHALFASVPTYNHKGVTYPMRFRCLASYPDGENFRSIQLSSKEMENDAVIYDYNEYGEKIQNQLSLFPENQAFLFGFGAAITSDNPNNTDDINGYIWVGPEYEKDPHGFINGRDTNKIDGGEYLIFTNVLKVGVLVDPDDSAKGNKIRLDHIDKTFYDRARFWWRGTNGKWSTLSKLVTDGPLAVNKNLKYPITSTGQRESGIPETIKKNKKNNKGDYSNEEWKWICQNISLSVIDSIYSYEKYFILNPANYRLYKIKPKDIIYCFKNTIYLKKDTNDLCNIYIPDITTFNEVYEGDVIINLKFKRESPSNSVPYGKYKIICNQNYDNSTKEIEFKFKNEEYDWEDQLTTHIKSSEIFNKEIKIFLDKYNLSNILITNGRAFTEDGEKLNSKVVYNSIVDQDKILNSLSSQIMTIAGVPVKNEFAYKQYLLGLENNQNWRQMIYNQDFIEMKVNNINESFTVDFEHTTDSNYNNLLYVGKTLGIPEQRYDSRGIYITGGNSNITALDYNGVNIVKA